MHMNLKRSISFLLLLATLFSLFGVGSFAAEEQGSEAAGESEIIEPTESVEPAESSVPEESAVPEESSAPIDTSTPTEAEAPAVTAEPVDQETESVTAEDGTGEEQAGETLPGATVTVTFYDYDGTTQLGSPVEITSGTSVTDIPKSGENVVSAWIYTVGEDTTEQSTTDIAALTLTANTKFTAAYKVTYLDAKGTSELAVEIVRKDASPTKAPTDSADYAKKITNWLADGKTLVVLSEQKITADTTFTAWVAPSLSTAHVAYISGAYGTDKSSGSKYSLFNPSGKLTRAQAAVMIYNLLADKTKGPIESSFSDVAAGSWYYDAVTTLASWGILTGKTDDKFEPTSNIKRNEFVVILCRLYTLESGTCNFSDINGEPTSKNSWYYNAVYTACTKGWVSGYKNSDGTYAFKPNNPLTRAEAVTILNRVLGRTPDAADKTAINNLNYRIFIDVVSYSTKNWYFYDVMEAATNDGYAIPSSTNSSLTTGYTTVNSMLYYINADHTYVYNTSGLQQMPDGLYYYFNSSGISFKKRDTGVYSIGGKLYIVKNDGTGSFVHDPVSNNDNRTYEYAQHLYYIETDGTLRKNAYYGTLYFGSNGAYTTGSNDLDAMVYTFLYNHNCLDNSISQEARLLRAYEAVRDYPSEMGSKGYNRGIYGVVDHSSDTYETCAYEWFQRATGTCIEWSGAMVFVARRLGFSARWEEGTVNNGSTKARAPHGWEVITISGVEYLFDVEQEWGRMYQYYNSDVRYCDCFKLEYNLGNYIYYGYRYYDESQYNTWSPYIAD